MFCHLHPGVFTKNLHREDENHFSNCIYYDIPVVDTIAPFTQGNSNEEVDSFYNALTVDGIHPNDAGHAIYARQVENVIDEMVTRSSGSETVPPPLNEVVSRFDHFLWYGKDTFIRNGNSLCMTLPPPGCNDIENFISNDNRVLMVIDQNDLPGRNSCNIMNNDQEIITRTINWPYTFSQRHIFPVSTNYAPVSGTLTLNFENEEQADGFNGIGFISGSSWPKDE